MIPNDKITREDRLKIVNTYLKNYNPIYGNLGVGFEVEKGNKKDYGFGGNACEWKLLFSAIGFIALSWAFITLYFLTFAK